MLQNLGMNPTAIATAQVMISNRLFYPLAHEVFEGNISDTKTLRQILARLALPEAILKPVVILDAGFVAKENLTPLRELGYSYLINITRGRHQ